MSFVVVFAPPAVLVTSDVSVQVSPVFAAPLSFGNRLAITACTWAMKRLDFGVASRSFTRPFGSTRPWSTPPLTLSTDSWLIGTVPSYFAESTTTCIVRPPVVSLSVIPTHAVSPMSCSVGGWPNPVRSIMACVLASIRNLIAAGAARGAGEPRGGPAGRGGGGARGGTTWRPPIRDGTGAGSVEGGRRYRRSRIFEW